jgi:3',5'-cyclic-AMP phosphodiesterase
MAAAGNGTFVIAQISDLHCGGPYFVPNLLERAISEVNELEPDVVICSGDLTNEGYRQEFKNWAAYADRIRAPMYTVPGNHDARNVGYLHFEELVGPRHWTADVKGVRLVGVDSSEPDINEGQVGRERYTWIHERFEVPADLKVFVLHHHLLPIPGTGRERSTVMDAGDLLEELIQSGVNIVLSGHKHVPYVWRLEDLYVANAGTVASLRLRGYTKPCYNVLEFENDEVKITRKYPFGGGSVIAHFRLSTGEQYHRELEPPVQQRRLPTAHQGES